MRFLLGYVRTMNSRSAFIDGEGKRSIFGGDEAESGVE